MARCKGQHHLIELRSGGLEITDGQTESIYERKLFLNGLGAVNVALNLGIGAVTPGLLDQMTAVGGGVDQHVVRAGLHAALDDGLEVLIFDLVLLKRKVVNIYNEAIIALLDSRNHAGQQPELVLVDLDHAQAVLEILVEHRLNAGGFTRSAVAVQQDVIGSLALDKGLGVLLELTLLVVVADQVGEQDSVSVLHRHELDVAIDLGHAEGTVDTKHSHAVVAVVGGEVIEHLVGTLGGGQAVAQEADMQANVGVIQTIALGDGDVVGQNGKDVGSKRLFPSGKIKMEQAMEDLQVVLCQQVDAAILRRAHALAGERKAVFVHHEVVGQVGLPEVGVKAVGGGEVKETFDQGVDAAAGVVHSLSASTSPYLL